LILLLVDVGPRRAGLLVLKLADVDFDLDVLLVLGKGRRERAWVPARASAFSRYEIYVRIVVDDPAASDRRRSGVHC
jgi:site-specific recombinase XerD